MNSYRLIARQIADGSGAPLFPGRVSVQNGVIAQVERGDFAPEAAVDAVLAEHEILAPAFLDAHGHSDLSVLAMPEARGKIAQGIGTEIAGNCGLSAFPLNERNRPHLADLYAQYRVPLDWDDFAGYRQTTLTRHAALDVIPLVGHNTLRSWAAGYEKKHLAPDELHRMEERLAMELAAGSPGLSFGLLYVPGIFADFEEIVTLMRVVAKFDRIVTVHLRSESAQLEEALAEIIDAARAAKLPKLHLSHLKTARPENFHKISAILAALAAPDLRVTGDVYCFDAAMSQLSVILPAPFDGMTDGAVEAALRTPEGFAEALKKMREERFPEYWERVGIVSAAAEFQGAAGRRIADLARERGCDPAELCLQVVRAGSAQATASFHTLSRENMERLAAHPRVVPGSDESARNATAKFGSSHPRGFGNAPEYFQLRRKQGAKITGIIREMTALPAEIFGLTDRGQIAPGKRAQLIAIDAENFRNHATFAAPHRLASGVRRV